MRQASDESARSLALATKKGLLWKDVVEAEDNAVELHLPSEPEDVNDEGYPVGHITVRVPLVFANSTLEDIKEWT